MSETIEFLSRRILVCGFECQGAARELASYEFVTLLPAYSPEEAAIALQAANALLDDGCKEFCCVGPESEWLEDELDHLIEDRDRPDVATTAFTNEAEACEYLLFAAGGGRSDVLLALVADHPSLLQRLRTEASMLQESSNKKE